MDSIMKSARSNSHRYVIDEDSIPKVTSDGEPHEIMTMVAAFSGVVAAVIVLLILIMLIGCRDSNRRRQQLQQQENVKLTKNKGVIIPIFNMSKIDGAPELMSISTISGSSGYDNPACDTPVEENRIVLTRMNLPEIATVRC